MKTWNCIIMGAAGRDFHDFQTFFLSHPEFRVRCFTATQIPFIENRSFPKEMAGPGYDEDIPIHLEKDLTELIERYEADFVALSYSDLPHEEVMHKASRVQAAGASFMLLGPRHTQLKSNKPVISVTAVRTGCGKSSISQKIAAHLTAAGKTVGVLRHPMPYGDLRRQEVQCFKTVEDLARHECTVEEREEYEPYVERGLSIYAGVDYAKVLKAAEAESDIILWDGGNNDVSFVVPGIRIVVADALRPGHGSAFYPGETNFRSADVLVINKVGEATEEAIAQVRKSAGELNPKATLIEGDLSLRVDNPEALRGKRALVVEDGPTVTHGGMHFGAGFLAAKRYDVSEIIDPRPYAVGSIKKAFEEYPHMERILPALGYSEEQRAELKATIDAAKPDVVVDASPARLARVLELSQPVVRVGYEFEQQSGPDLIELVDAFVRKAGGK